MIHVKATACTLMPAPFLIGGIWGTSVTMQHHYEILAMIGLAVSLIAGGLQFALIVAKFQKDSEVEVVRASYWRKLDALADINRQKESVEQFLLSIRHLSASHERYEFTQSDYRSIAFLQVSHQFDHLAMNLWGQSAIKVGYDQDYDFMASSKLSTLYAYAQKIAEKMDKTKLDQAKNELIEAKKRELKNEDVFEYLQVILRESQSKQTIDSRVSDAVFARASLFLNHEIMDGLSEQNYHLFAKFIAQNKTSISLEPLINFLNAHPHKVNWSLMIDMFNEHFKGAISVYEPVMQKFQDNLIIYQKDYDFEQLCEKAKFEAQSVLTQPLLFDEQQSLPSFISPSDSCATLSPRVHGFFKPCSYIEHQSKTFPAQWDDLRHHYTTLLNHQDKIAPSELMNLNSILNSCLPLLITIDKNLSSFPHMNPEQTENLLSENLDLAISQIKKLINDVDHSFTKDLKATKHYQTMKMNAT